MSSKNVLIVFAILFITVGFLEKISGQRKLKASRKSVSTLIKKKKVTHAKPKMRAKKPVSQSVNVKESSVEKNFVDTVPWKKLKEDWKETLRYNLSRLQPDNSEEIFNTYRELEKAYYLKIGKVNSEMNSLYSYDSKSQEIVFKDKARYMALARTRNFYSDQHLARVKEIFGKNFRYLKAIYKDFEESIQVYNNDE